MVRGPIETSAAARARWLAELGEALDHARQVLDRLGGAGAGIEVAELSARIETASLEVEVMRLRRSSAVSQDVDPEWINNIPWKLSA